MEREAHAPKRRLLSRAKVTTAVAVLVAVVALSLAGYTYWQYNQLKNDPTASQKASDAKVSAIKAKVAKLISIPADETPTLASVTDKTKLKDQPFFKDAENGDQILIFSQAKKAVIYRESENKLINVGPIAITSDTAKKDGQN